MLPEPELEPELPPELPPDEPPEDAKPVTTPPRPLNPKLKNLRWDGILAANPVAPPFLALLLFGWAFWLEPPFEPCWAASPQDWESDWTSVSPFIILNILHTKLAISAGVVCFKVYVVETGGTSNFATIFFAIATSFAVPNTNNSFATALVTTTSQFDNPGVFFENIFWFKKFAIIAAST